MTGYHTAISTTARCFPTQFLFHCTVTSARPAEELSEYERQRQKNIAENMMVLEVCATHDLSAQRVDASLLSGEVDGWSTLGLSDYFHGI